MKKQRIVLASVLKPVDDTRMFEKIGKSLSNNPNFEIFIIGYPSKQPQVDPKITFLPHPNFVRLSLKRVLMPLIILQKLCKVKPDVLIVNTHELLTVAILIRIFFGCKIIYDVQENYWRNILWTDTFPSLIKPLLARWVRGKEILLARFIHLFLLAEKGFEKEMKFFGNNFIVLENKSVLPNGFARSKSGRTSNLLFSGTISESTGVFEAINLANILHQHDQSVRLQIIGYCALSSTLQAVKQAIVGKPFISLTGGDQLVPHHKILDQISNSDFGIIYYPSSRHTENKIPTKLYEYLSARLPILIQNYPPWVKLCEPYPAAIPIDFISPPDAATLLRKMQQADFYKTAPIDVLWTSEEKKLFDSLNIILV
jgi:glycosyltransferase involved in cell wall biosynthesis